MEQLEHERIVQFIRHEIPKDSDGININSISCLLLFTSLSLKLILKKLLLPNKLSVFVFVVINTFA